MLVDVSHPGSFVYPTNKLLNFSKHQFSHYKNEKIIE